jgi:hypothetical protein
MRLFFIPIGNKVWALLLLKIRDGLFMKKLLLDDKGADLTLVQDGQYLIIYSSHTIDPEQLENIDETAEIEVHLKMNPDKKLSV